MKFKTALRENFLPVTLCKIINLYGGPFGNIYQNYSPGWYGSVDRTLACEPESRRFNSQLGHMPGLQARSPDRGMWEAAYQCISFTSMFLSPLFLPPFPSLKSKINKIFKKVINTLILWPSNPVSGDFFYKRTYILKKWHTQCYIQAQNREQAKEVLIDTG